MTSVLQVRVLSARNLNNEDNFTANDAFVEIYIEDKNYKQRTTTVSSKTPEWNQTFTLNFPNGQHTLHLAVMDKDIMDTDAIGYAKFDFSKLNKGKTERHELPLYKHGLDFTANGYITVETTLLVSLHSQSIDPNNPTLLTKMVQAWFFEETAEDQRETHQYKPNKPVSLEQLKKLGISYFHIPIQADDSHMDTINKISAENNYKGRDVVNIHKDTFPNYDAKIKDFFEEHIHEDEEIRYILDGSGYFDVRDEKDRWIRIAVEPSDMIIVPAGIYHRFTLDTNNFIKAMRLFQEMPKWTPINRSIPSTEQNNFRVAFLSMLTKTFGEDGVRVGEVAALEA
ncbi:1,2-dihydroxy-3-keto-5-methylthiopentene dioxygenase [Chytridiales sp. JEL 0842]|nr:1,2-dihydroxy-3-keto-5-methylthiopentene dioxygenase [Chytridiales sp. JEL 0842]